MPVLAVLISACNVLSVDKRSDAPGVLHSAEGAQLYAAADFGDGVVLAGRAGYVQVFFDVSEEASEVRLPDNSCEVDEIIPFADGVVVGCARGSGLYQISLARGTAEITELSLPDCARPDSGISSITKVADGSLAFVSRYCGKLYLLKVNEKLLSEIQLELTEPYAANFIDPYLVVTSFSEGRVVAKISKNDGFAQTVADIAFDGAYRVGSNLRGDIAVSSVSGAVLLLDSSLSIESELKLDGGKSAHLNDVQGVGEEFLIILRKPNPQILLLDKANRFSNCFPEGELQEPTRFLVYSNPNDATNEVGFVDQGEGTLQVEESGELLAGCHNRN